MIGGLSLLLIVLLLPLWMGKIGPNSFYGYRTPYSMSSRERWFYMNRFAAMVYIPFFGCLLIAEFLISPKLLVWILLAGVVALLIVCLLEEKRQKWLERRKEKQKTKSFES